MSDDNWFWQVSKMTYFKRLDRLMVGKSKLDLCQDYVGSCICKDQHGLAKNTKEQRQGLQINIRGLIRPGRYLDCPIWRGWV